MKLKILVINKKNSFSNQLIELINQLGHHVEYVENGDTGLDLIVSNKHNLVIVNDSLEDTNAQDFIIKASQRKVFCHSAFMLISPHHLDEMNKIRFMSLGFSYFMTEQIDEQNKNAVMTAIQDEINMLPLLSAA